MTETWAIFMTILAVFVGGYGSVLLKFGAKDFALSIKGTLKNIPLMKGVVLYGLSSVIFVTALTGGELSVLYPLVSTVYILVAFFSMYVLKEKMNVYKWLGIALIIIGVSCIGVGA